MRRPPPWGESAAESRQRQKIVEMEDAAAADARPDPSDELTAFSDEGGSQAAGFSCAANGERDLRVRADEHVGDVQGRADGAAVSGDHSRRRGEGSSAGSGARGAGVRRDGSGAEGRAARGGAWPREHGCGA